MGEFEFAFKLICALNTKHDDDFPFSFGKCFSFHTWKILNLSEKLKQNCFKSRHKFNNCFVELISFLLFKKLILFRRFSPERDDISLLLQIKLCQKRFVPLWRWVHEKHKYFITLWILKQTCMRRKWEILINKSFASG